MFLNLSKCPPVFSDASWYTACSLKSRISCSLFFFPSLRFKTNVLITVKYTFSCLSPSQSHFLHLFFFYFLLSSRYLWFLFLSCRQRVTSDRIRQAQPARFVHVCVRLSSIKAGCVGGDHLHAVLGTRSRHQHPLPGSCSQSTFRILNDYYFYLKQIIDGINLKHALWCSSCSIWLIMTKQMLETHVFMHEFGTFL